MSFSILLTNNNRAKAYIQNLAREGLLPDGAVVLGDQRPVRVEDRALTGGGPRIHASRDTGNSFDEAEPVTRTLDRHGVAYVRLPTLDPNAPEIVQAVAGLPGQNVLYAGPGGVILRQGLLGLGKTFLHAHPGRLPHYRGSTTFYYSLLAESRIWCSVIGMTAKVDAGPIFDIAEYEYTEPSVDIDHVLDPLARAASMTRFLAKIRDGAAPEPLLPRQEGGDTYFIIHPALKHMAVLAARGRCPSPAPTVTAGAGKRAEHDEGGHHG